MAKAGGDGGEDGSDDAAVGYVGAIVLEPVTGFHDAPQGVVCVDFNSLYPSLIISYNLDLTTILVDKRYDRPGLQIEEYDGVRVVQTGKPGVIPGILTELLALRKAAKRKMAAAAAAGDSLMQSIYNAQQSSFKVTAN